MWLSWLYFLHSIKSDQFVSAFVSIALYFGVRCMFRYKKTRFDFSFPQEHLAFSSCAFFALHASFSLLNWIAYGKTHGNGHIHSRFDIYFHFISISCQCDNEMDNCCVTIASVNHNLNFTTEVCPIYAITSNNIAKKWLNFDFQADSKSLRIQMRTVQAKNVSQYQNVTVMLP